MDIREKRARFREIARKINPDFDKGIPTDFSKVDNAEDAFFLFEFFNKNSAEAFDEVFNLNKKNKQKFMMNLGDFMFNLYLEKKDPPTDQIGRDKSNLIRSVFYDKLPQILKW